MEAKEPTNLNQVVLDHLTKEGYIKAVKAMKEEIKANKKKVKKNPQKKVDEMLKCFEDGEQAKFISLWNENVGKNNTEDLYGSKIEFYVRIYFTIFPMHSLSKGK